MLLPNQLRAIRAIYFGLYEHDTEVRYIINRMIARAKGPTYGQHLNMQQQQWPLKIVTPRFRSVAIIGRCVSVISNSFCFDLEKTKKRNAWNVWSIWNSLPWAQELCSSCGGGGQERFFNSFLSMQRHRANVKVNQSWRGSCPLCLSLLPTSMLTATLSLRWF